MNNGYIECYKPEHPRAKKNGFVYKHIVEAEKLIGRFLKSDEVVHHKNQKRDDNRPENLIVFRSRRDHSIFHKTGKLYFDSDGIAYCEKAINRCPDCGAIIDRKAKYCQLHYINHRNYKLVGISNEELIDVVKRTNFSQAAKILGVTESAIRRRFIREGLPFHSKDYK